MSGDSRDTLLPSAGHAESDGPAGSASGPAPSAPISISAVLWSIRTAGRPVLSAAALGDVERRPDRGRSRHRRHPRYHRTWRNPVLHGLRHAHRWPAIAPHRHLWEPIKHHQWLHVHRGRGFQQTCLRELPGEPAGELDDGHGRAPGVEYERDVAGTGFRQVCDCMAGPGRRTDVGRRRFVPSHPIGRPPGFDLLHVLPTLDRRHNNPAVLLPDPVSGCRIPLGEWRTATTYQFALRWTDQFAVGFQRWTTGPQPPPNRPISYIPCIRFCPVP